MAEGPVVRCGSGFPQKRRLVRTTGPTTAPWKRAEAPPGWCAQLPGRTARIFSQLWESHLTRDSPGIPGGRIRSWHAQLPPYGTIVAHVSHRHPASFPPDPEQSVGYHNQSTAGMRPRQDDIRTGIVVITHTEGASAGAGSADWPGQGIPIGPEQGLLEGIEFQALLAFQINEKRPAPH